MATLIMRVVVEMIYCVLRSSVFLRRRFYLFIYVLYMIELMIMHMRVDVLNMACEMAGL